MNYFVTFPCILHICIFRCLHYIMVGLQTCNGLSNSQKWSYIRKAFKKWRKFFKAALIFFSALSGLVTYLFNFWKLSLATDSFLTTDTLRTRQLVSLWTWFGPTPIHFTPQQESTLSGRTEPSPWCGNFVNLDSVKNCQWNFIKCTWTLIHWQ